MNEKVSGRLKNFTRDYMSLIAVLLIFVIFSFTSPYFLKLNNVMNIFLQTATVAIVAIGQGMLIITGQVDLSLGYQVCITGCIFAYMMKFQGWNPIAAILLALLVGCVAGAVNGFLVAYCNIPAFIATLGIQYVCRGLAKIITNATPIGNLPKSISVLGNGYVGFIPVPVLIMLILFAVGNRVPIIAVIIMIWRDTIVDGLRMSASAKGKVVAAGMPGKIKTVLQMFAIIFVMLYDLPFAYLGIPMDQIFIWGATIASVYSGIVYFMKLKDVVMETM